MKATNTSAYTVVQRLVVPVHEVRICEQLLEVRHLLAVLCRNPAVRVEGGSGSTDAGTSLRSRT